MRILDWNVFAIRYLIFYATNRFPSADVDELRAEFYSSLSTCKCEEEFFSLFTYWIIRCEEWRIIAYVWFSFSKLERSLKRQFSATAEFDDPCTMGKEKNFIFAHNFFAWMWNVPTNRKYWMNFVAIELVWWRQLFCCVGASSSALSTQ